MEEPVARPILRLVTEIFGPVGGIADHRAVAEDLAQPLVLGQHQPEKSAQGHPGAEQQEQNEQEDPDGLYFTHGLPVASLAGDFRLDPVLAEEQDADQVVGQRHRFHAERRRQIEICPLETTLHRPLILQVQR